MNFYYMLIGCFQSQTGETRFPTANCGWIGLSWGAAKRVGGSDFPGFSTRSRRKKMNASV